VSELFLDGGTVTIDFDGRIKTYTTKAWLDMTSEIFEYDSSISDRLTERSITVYGNIAVATCRYDFDSRFEHSFGHDIFSLARYGDNWLIVSLMYSGQRK
jgi:hypothetical protein